MHAEKVKEAIARDVLNLLATCDEYNCLMGEESENVAILNEAATKFFAIYQMVIWGDLVISLSRITGPKATRRGKQTIENLTIQLLPDLVDPIFRSEVSEKVDIAIEKSSFVLAARNKIFAHRDLAVALSPNAEGIRRGNLHEMREAVWAVVEAVESAIPNTVKWHSIKRAGGASDLVELLKFALEKKIKINN